MLGNFLSRRDAVRRKRREPATSTTTMNSNSCCKAKANRRDAKYWETQKMKTEKTVQCNRYATRILQQRTQNAWCSSWEWKWWFIGRSVYTNVCRPSYMHSTKPAPLVNALRLQIYYLFSISKSLRLSLSLSFSISLRHSLSFLNARAASEGQNSFATFGQMKSPLQSVEQSNFLIEWI